MLGVALAVTATVAVFLLWKGRAPKVVALLALVTGAGLSGGAVGSLMRQLVHSLAGVTGQLTAELIGVAVPAVLGVWVVLHVSHDMLPGNSAGRVTALVAFLLPLVGPLIPGALGEFVLSVSKLIETSIADLVKAMVGGS